MRTDEGHLATRDICPLLHDMIKKSCSLDQAQNYMFQPTPTPLFHQSCRGVDYSFPPATLRQGQGDSSSSSGGGGAKARGLGPDACNAYASPIFQSHHLDTNHNHNSQQHHFHRSPFPPHQARGSRYPISHSARHHLVRMEVKMEPPSDLAQQEAAAREYKPELEGPLVGEKKSSHAIAEEYAKANPTYSKYRAIQGDGNCGWRAIGFAYFENLIRCGDIEQLQAESARLTALNDYIENVGQFEAFLIEPMSDFTLELMEKIIQAVTQGQDAMAILKEHWTDEMSSHSMIYHLRLLAASWLKGNLSDYEHFITSDANTYCEEWILPVNKEIDQVAIDLLFNIFLKPANMVLEIAYLDTSAGTEVNVHRWPQEAKDKDPATLGPMINLLYRPGHYDLLYRDAIPPAPKPPAGPISYQVHRVGSFSGQHKIESVGPSGGSYPSFDMSTLAMIPGFEPAPAAFSPLGSPPPISPMGSAYAHSPQSTWLPPQPYADELASAPSPMSSTHSAPSQPSPQPQSQDGSSGLTSLRFSKHMFPVPGAAEASSYAPEPAFQVQTNIFKQSFYNTAHFNNPHFQPEEYRPDEDDEIPKGRMSCRKRSS